jgi:hypothetical protein
MLWGGENGCSVDRFSLCEFDIHGVCLSLILTQVVTYESLL